MRKLIVPIVLLFGPAVAAADPAPEWGKLTHGLQSKLTVVETLQAKTSCAFTLTVRNPGKQAVALAAQDRVTGWLFVGQGKGRSFYSKRIPCTLDVKDWPQKLAPGRTITIPLDVTDVVLYRFPRDFKLVDGYPQSTGKTAPRAVGVLKDVLTPARQAAVSFILLFPGREKTLSVSSNSLLADVRAPVLKEMGPVEREAYTKELVDRFLKNASSAQQACALAIALGPQVTEILVPLALDPKRHDHSRMWLATALAHIGDETAVDALVKLVTDKNDGVRNVVAYHGIKTNAEKLDAAIIARALKGDGMVTYWAVRGFTTFRQQPPAELLGAALKSPNEKARVSAVIAIGKRGRDKDIARLIRLLKDKNERTRAAAANALATAGSNDKATLAALVAALDDAGDFSAMYICMALDKLTGSNGAYIYDAKADAETRTEIINHWKGWGRTVLPQK